MTDEQLKKVLAEEIHTNSVFTELCQGVAAMSIKERILIKQIASHLGIWDKVIQDLAAAKTLSWRDKVECRTSVLAESEYNIPDLFHSAWMAIYTLYQAGEMKQVEALLIISRGPEDYQRGKSVADIAVREFLNRR